MDFLDTIRSQPSDAKARYAFIVSSVVTAAIAFVWATTLPARFSGMAKVDDVIDAEDASGFEKISDLFVDTKTQLGSAVESGGGAGAVGEHGVAAPPPDGAPKEFTPSNLNAFATGTTAPEDRIDDGGVVPADTATATEETASASPQPEPVSEPVREEPHEPKVILIGTTTSKTTDN